MAGRTHTLGDVGEDALVALLVKGLPQGRDVVVGPGDDCAVVRSGERDTYGLLKTDCVVEGVHYASDAAPAAVGWKAMARVLSDIAAMGGSPKHALVTVLMRPEREVSYVRGIYRGIAKAVKAHRVGVVGGETSSAETCMLSVSMTGTVERRQCALRSGGRAGDVLYVTGRLGGSMRGKHLRFQPRLAEAKWLVEQFRMGAMMDLSDGLAKDLPRLARASGVGFEVDAARIPRTRGCSVEEAMGDGEDYELLFAVRKTGAEALEAQWRRRFPKLPLSRIGRLTKRTESTPLSGGWEHFTTR